MANPSTVVAHIIKLIVTVTCMKFFRDSYALRPTDYVWAVRAFQIILLHSLLGIFRFSGTNTTKRFRIFYDWFSSAVDVIPFAFFTSEILLKYKVNEELRFLLLALGLLPIFIELTSPRMKNRWKLYTFTNITFAFESLAISIVCLQNGNYGGLSLAASYAVARYISEDFCDRFEVPYKDLSQYSLSFVEAFAILTLREL